jgi:N-acyl-phosphatidylethanolamine-hydrolysing phospholipase D
LPSHTDTPLRVALPFFVRRITASLVGARGKPPPIVPVDEALIDAVQGEQGYSLTWVGHSTFLVQMGGVRFLTDPTWSNTASPLRVGPTRFVEPGLDLDAVGHIDFVVISHNHYDHMDIGTLQALSDAGTKFYVPLANRETLLRHGIAPVVELDWWQSEMVGDAEVHCVPARHWSRRGITDMDRALWSGWVVRVGDRVLYFAGDTGVFPGFSEIARRLGPIDLAAMPIGAYEPRAMMAPAHLNPEEAIDAVVALDARHSVAMHFGTFDLSDEALGEPPERFRASSLAAGRGPEADWVLAIGETRRF